jgi:ABC-type multidrug transport system fused ATPase/permease subunit
MLRRASTGVQDRVAEAMGTADESFSQIRTVQSFVREAEETRRFGAQLADVVKAAVRRAMLRALFFGVVGVRRLRRRVGRALAGRPARAGRARSRRAGS